MIRKLLAGSLLLFSVSTLHADIAGAPAGAYIRDQAQPQPNAQMNIASGTVRGQFTITDLTILGSCTGCPGGSGGSGPSGQINLSAQFRVPYYSVSGSSNSLSGDSNLTYVPSTQLLTVTTLAANTVSPKTGSTVLILNPTVSTITTTGNNILIGPSGMPSAISPNDLVAIGRQALASNVSGLRNVAIGSYALGLSTSTSGAVAIGYQAAYRFSPGNFSTGLVAIGDNALANYGQNNGSVYATAVGYGAASAATKGIVLTAIGYGSAVNNTGDYTTAVGGQSLPSHTSGDFVTGIGAAAGITDSTGTGNTYVGAYSGYSNQHGDYNTYLGYAAGVFHLGNGDGNTGIGQGSMNTVYGSYNTVLGMGAGVTDSALAPVNHSGAIGFSANVAKSNAFMIGSDNPSYSMDVGIATSTPRERLHVTGGNIRIDSANSFKFYDLDNSNYVAFKAANVTTSNVTWTMPAADAVGCFQSDGAGGVTIGTCGTGGGSGSVNGTIVASPQFRLPYYSVAGTTTTVTGDANITTDGSGVLSSYQHIIKPRSGTAGNLQIQNTAGNAQGTLTNPGSTGQSKIDIAALDGISLTGPVTGSTMTLTQRLIFPDGTFATSTASFGGTSGINNQSNQQAGAQFSVSTGTFDVGLLFSTSSENALMRLKHWSGTGNVKLFHIWPRTINAVNQDLFVGQGAGANYAGAGSGNVGIGPTALSGITSGSGNIGLGNYAGTYWTTGSENIAIGNQSALNSIGGTQTGNIIIGGGQAGPKVTTDYNTIIGYHAGWLRPEDLSTGVIGDGNVMVGPNSTLGREIDNTVAVGRDTVIYGTNSIAIGYGATVSTGSTNSIAIGYGATVSSDSPNTMQIGGPDGSPTAMHVYLSTLSVRSLEILGSGPGKIILLEGPTLSGGVANKDIIFADSNAHRFRMVNNNGSIESIVGTTDTGQSGECAQFDSDGTVTGTGAPCLSGVTNPVTASAQYQMARYESAGSSSQVVGDPNFTNNGTTITMSGMSTVVQSNVSTVTATGVYFDHTGSSLTITSLTILGTCTGCPGGSGSGGDSFGSHIATKTVTAGYGLVTTTVTASAYYGTTSSFTATGSGGLSVVYGATLGSATVSDLTVALPVQTDSNKKLISLAIDLSGTQASGTLGSARMPALTGDITTTLGTVATTLASQIAGAKTFTSSMTNTSAGGERVTYGIVAGSATVNDDAYAAGWDGSTLVPTKNAIYDKIETLGSSSGGGLALQPSTSTIQIAKGLYLGTSTVTGSYTIVSTDTVIFATGALATNPVTYTLPSAASACRNGTGQVIQITKVDTSTGAVKVQIAGSDLIGGTTGTIMLNAIGQTAELISDCNSKWWAHGQGIQQTPAYIGWNGDGGSANSKISSTTYICPMTVPVPVAATGFTWYVQTAAAGSFATLSIYDSNLNLVTSTGPILVGGFGFNTTTITPVNLPPGQYYYGWQQAVATVAISDQPGAGNAGNGNTICSSNTDTDLVPPNPFVLGTASAKPGPAINIRIAGGRTGL